MVSFACLEGRAAVRAFQVGDRVRCIRPGPLGSEAEIGMVSIVIECSPQGRIRLAPHAPFCHPGRFELVIPAAAAATPVERAEDVVRWFALCAAGSMPPVARASCLRGMRAVMEAAFGMTFHANAQGQVAFEPLARA